MTRLWSAPLPNLLLIEPASIVRESISMVLGTHGFEVTAADSARSAMSAIGQCKPDVIVLEPALGDYDGLKLIARIKEAMNAPNLPIVLLTDINEKSQVIRARQLGIRHLQLKKFFTAEQFLHRIEMAMNAEARLNSEANEKSRGGRLYSAEPAEDLPESIAGIQPKLTRDEAIDRIVSFGECRALSPTLQLALALIDDPSSSIEKVADVVKRDQGLALAVLRAANSSTFRRGGPVSSVEQGALRLGLEELRSVIVCVSVIDHFGGGDFDHLINVMSFWEHSLAAALTCQHLAPLIGMDREQAFMMGLMHDIGRIVLVEQFGKDYLRAFELAEHLKQPLDRIEKRLLGIDHTDVADVLFSTWGFPNEVRTPIANHHLSLGNLKHLVPSSMKATAMLALADSFAHACMLGDSGSGQLRPIEHYARELELTPQRLLTIEQRVIEQVYELRLAIAAASNIAPAKDMLDQLIKTIGHGGVIFATSVDERAAPDVFRTWTRRLTAAQKDREPQPPIFALVHLQRDEDLRTVMESVEAQEAAAEVTNLPMVIVHQSKTALKPERFPDRAVTTLQLPTMAWVIASEAKRLMSINPGRTIAAA